MVRTRRSRPELTDSWADIDDDETSSQTTSGHRIYSEDDERSEMADEYRARTPGRISGSRSSLRRREEEDVADETPRQRRNLRSSVEPVELVMPSSPDAAAAASGVTAAARSAKARAQTPRFRINERSMTSDAGALRELPQRAQTPHFRLNERSMTSDAGRFRGSGLKREYDEDEATADGDASGGGGVDVGEKVGVLWQRVVRPLLGYAGSVLGLAGQNAKPILGWLVLLYALVAAFVFASGFVTNSLNHALSPICRLPFTSSLPFCPQVNAPELKGTAEFGKLVQAQDAFQDVLASSSTGVNLPLDMKRSEAGIRDLKHVVQYSKLESRNELVFEFTGFIETARQASQDLSKFNSRIGRAVDHILSTNRWTLSVIDSVRSDEASRGALSRWVSENVNIFAAFQPLSLSRDILLDQYLRHTSAVEEQILHLIAEAHALRDILDNLDNRLDIIASITTRDGLKLESNKDELFASLWTKLGGNRSSVAKLQQQLALLQNVGTYRRQAWGHVTSTLVKLQAIQHSLEDLRERVALPETVGTDRVPLEVHIESINLGIERLEAQRDANRRLEAEKYAKVISRAEASEGKMIGEKEL